MLPHHGGCVPPHLSAAWKPEHLKALLMEFLRGEPFPGNSKLYRLFLRELDIRGVGFSESQDHLWYPVIVVTGRCIRKNLDP